MNKEYRFDLPDHKSAIFKKLSFFLYFINIAAFVLTGVYSINKTDQFIFFGLSLLLLLLAFADIKKRGKKLFIVIYLLSAIAWFTLTPFWYFGLMNIILGILHWSIEKEKFVLFSDEHIIAQGGARKEWNWNEISQVILKDGLLTIDFRNNRIIQVEPEMPVNDNKDYTEREKEFNEFCRLKLNA